MFSPSLTSKFEILQEIGRGAFSKVYEGIHHLARDRATALPVALKMTDLSQSPQTGTEVMLLSLKNQPEGSLYPGIPRLYSHEVIGNSSVTVLELLGPSFFSIMQTQKTPLSLEVVVRGTYGILKVLKWMHKKGFVHRDVKPDNILFGYGVKANRVFLIDFEDAHKFRSGQPAENTVGNPYFISLNVLKGGEEGPKDDLESLTCSIVYLLQGTLPWMNVMEAEPERLKKQVAAQKEAVSVSHLCKLIPRELQDILDHARSLSSVDMPDYPMLINRLKSLGKRISVHLKPQEILTDKHFLKRNSFSVHPSATPTTTSRSYSLRHAELLSPNTYSKLPTTHGRAKSIPNLEMPPINEADIPTLVNKKLPALTINLQHEIERKKMRR